MILNCPLPTTLTTIPTGCPFNFDQIIRVGFQQRQATASFADETEIQTLADWTALIAASDATKIVMSPVFSGFVIPKSEVQASGGNDNSTVKGIREIYGNGSVTVSGTYKGLNPTILAALDNLTQFSIPNSVGNSTLTWYMFNKDGYLFYADGFFGIEIFNFIVGTAGSEGLNSKNQNDFMADFKPDWDRILKVTKPTFDPLTQL